MIKKEHIVITILTTVTLVFGFYATDQYMASQLLCGKHFWNPSVQWDQAISFNPQWVWIYLLYFPLCFLPITLKEIWKDKIAFRRTAAGFILQFIFAFTIFWIFPSQMERPIFSPLGVSSQVLLWFYKIDAGYNIFPSLHVANIAYIACVAWKFKRRSLSTAVWALCFMIAASTLFVKQHYLFDLPFGIVTGVLGYFIAFSKRMRFLDSRKARPLITILPQLDRKKILTAKA